MRNVAQHNVWHKLTSGKEIEVETQGFGTMEEEADNSPWKPEPGLLNKVGFR